MAQKVLVLGASGKIGAHSARAFAAAGWDVRKFDRSRDDMTDAAEGADVIVNGMSPPGYHDWDRLIPQITDAVIAAARASGATVIIPGNVYNFGDTPGVWDENTPQRPVSRKGRIRVETESAYRNAGVKTIILRAGNFIDPDQNGDVMSLVLMRAIAKGHFTFPGDPATMQAYCYLPDWARAAAALAERRTGLARFEDIPFPGHAFTALELRDHLRKALKREFKIAGFPWALMRLLSPFWELARELNEMRYLWSTDHRLSPAKFNRLVPDFQATDMSVVMNAGLPADIHPDQPVPTGARIAT